MTWWNADSAAAWGCRPLLFVSPARPWRRLIAGLAAISMAGRPAVFWVKAVGMWPLYFFVAFLLSVTVRDFSGFALRATEIRNDSDKPQEGQMQTTFAEFYEDMNDALREAVRAIGGNKKAGPKLWPELLEEQAANRLRDSLNPEKRDKLSPEQVMLLLRLAGQAGFHGAMGFVAYTAGYEAPRPVLPEDQENQLQRQFVDAVQALQQIQHQLTKVQALRRAA